MKTTSQTLHTKLLLAGRNGTLARIVVASPALRADFACTCRVRKLADSIRGHLADGRRGEILRSGVQVAILGPPNAGKSSLLNVLARRPAAIVSAVAGTTRDVVQVPLNIAGYPVIVSDTAGLRETEDLIEKEGVRRAQQCATEADICVVMMDIQVCDGIAKPWFCAPTNSFRLCRMLLFSTATSTSPI
jgi:tRNA U34 5-carboxymethylaminomethyl modifying GTPase MnmE/TrmE